MDNTNGSKQNRRQSTLSRLLLLLFLTGLQPGLCSDTEQTQPPSDNEPLQAEIIGPTYVTVGVPSSFECDANCTACAYSMSLDGENQVQGNVLAFTVDKWMMGLTVSCIVMNELTDQTATVTKRLLVLVGPANVSISGPELMSPTATSTYICQASCRPSCSYTWKIDQGPWIGGQPNSLSVHPREADNITALTCKATNTVSGLFVSTTRKIIMITGPSNIHITGPDVIEIAKQYKYVCTAECHPSCRYVMSADNQSVRGNVIELTMDYPLQTVTLKCEAYNTASRKTATVVKTVHLKGAVSSHNLSTRPQETSAALLLAFIISTAFTW